MKVGWVYPHKERCGIAIYARNYISTEFLKNKVVSIDPQWWNGNRKRIKAMFAECNVLHIQYDTASFLHGKHDYFSAMIHSFNGPVVVSVHEIYREDPFAYPRTLVQGILPVKMFRLFWYDRQHPVQHAFTVHAAASFYAQRILVHHVYHGNVLRGKKTDTAKVDVIPHPVKKTVSCNEFKILDSSVLHLGAIGFVNPAYDYDLLFKVLEHIGRPWTFTWIGGPKSGITDQLFCDLQKKIQRSGWEQRFTISGWVSENEMQRRLRSIAIVMALFKWRSSSGSLAVAMGALKPVCAVRGELSEEIAGYQGGTIDDESYRSPIMLVNSNYRDIVDCINSFVTSPLAQKRLFACLAAYVATMTYENSAGKLVALYQELLEQ